MILQLSSKNFNPVFVSSTWVIVWNFGSNLLFATGLHQLKQCDSDAGASLALGGLIWFLVKRQPISLWHGLALGLAQLLLSAQSLRAWKKGASSMPYIVGSLGESNMSTFLTSSKRDSFKIILEEVFRFHNIPCSVLAAFFRNEDFSVRSCV